MVMASFMFFITLLHVISASEAKPVPVCFRWNTEANKVGALPTPSLPLSHSSHFAWNFSRSSTGMKPPFVTQKQEVCVVGSAFIKDLKSDEPWRNLRVPFLVPLKQSQHWSLLTRPHLSSLRLTPGLGVWFPLSARTGLAFEHREKEPLSLTAYPPTPR